jgi:hypothetical protein
MGSDVEHPPFISDADDSRVCPRKGCGRVYSSGYPDPCLGFIPGASEACCGHGIIYHDEALEPGFGVEGEPYVIFPPDDPNYVLDPTKHHEDHIRVYFPRLTDPARVKAVALAISAALGRANETFTRNPHRIAVPPAAGSADRG